jgi:hypothetical protein
MAHVAKVAPACHSKVSGLNTTTGPRHALPPAMTDVLYRCATTGQNVQVWFADDVPDDSVYISLRCPALRQSPSRQPSG